MILWQVFGLSNSFIFVGRRLPQAEGILIRACGRNRHGTGERPVWRRMRKDVLLH